MMVTEKQYIAKTTRATSRVVSLRDKIHRQQWIITKAETAIRKLKDELAKAEVDYAAARSLKVRRK